MTRLSVRRIPSGPAWFPALAAALAACAGAPPADPRAEAARLLLESARAALFAPSEPDSANPESEIENPKSWASSIAPALPPNKGAALLAGSTFADLRVLSAVSRPLDLETWNDLLSRARQESGERVSPNPQSAIHNPQTRILVLEIFLRADPLPERPAPGLPFEFEVGVTGVLAADSAGRAGYLSGLEILVETLLDGEADPDLQRFLAAARRRRSPAGSPEAGSSGSLVVAEIWAAVFPAGMNASPRDRLPVRLERGLAARPSPVSSRAGFPREAVGAATEAALHLARAVDEKGRFRYLYDPLRDAEGPGYNVLRHAGSVYAMAGYLAAVRPADFGSRIPEFGARGPGKGSGFRVPGSGLGEGSSRYPIPQSEIRNPKSEIEPDGSAGASPSPENPQSAIRNPQSAIEGAVLRALGEMKRNLGFAGGGLAYLRKGDSAPLGGAALALLALIEARRAGLRGSPGERASDDDLMGKLKKTLLFMSLPGGRFFNDLDEAREGELPEREAIYYPGEALLALVRYARVFEDRSGLDRLRAAARRQHGRFAKEGLFDHWTAQALAELFLWTGEEEFGRACLEEADYVVGRQFTEENAPRPDHLGGFREDLPLRSTPAACRLEALGLALRVAKKMGRDPRSYEDAIRLTSSFLARLQVSRPEAAFFPAPDRVEGGVRGGLLDWTLRIDFTQHALTGWVNSLAGWQ